MKIVITLVDEYDDERVEEIKQMVKNRDINFIDYVRLVATEFAEDIVNEYQCVEGETFTHNVEVIE